MFSKSDKLTKLIHTNYHLLPVLNRFGIKLGVKDFTVTDICNKLNIDSDFFLAIINTFHDKDYFPEKELKAFSPLTIIDYLQKTHQHYINYVLPKLERLLHQLVNSSKKENTEFGLIEKFFKKYEEEFLLHIKYEEDTVFPYIRKKIKKENIGEAHPAFSFEKEHGNVDIKLNDLKSLVIKYIEPIYDNNLCNEFLITLFRFEKDVMDHARIEDNILIPLVLEIEKSYNE